MSTQIRAAQRLLVTAEGEWWDSLTDDMRKMYIDEHPDSKYAKGYQMHKHPGTEGQKPAQPEQPKGPAGPKDPETQERLRRLPKPVQKFVQSGGTAKGSKARKETGSKIKAQNHTLARGVLKDVAGAASGIRSTYNLLNGKPKEGDAKKIASFMANVLGATVVTAAIGATGPVGILTFLAIKHIGAPILADIAKDAWKDLTEPTDWKPSGRGTAENPDYGYWKDKDTWVPIPKKDWENMTDKEANDYFDKGHDPSGKFKSLEDKHLKPKTTSALDRLGASTVTATEDEEYMKALLDGICDYAEDGDVPDDAWKAAIAELEGQKPSEEQKPES
jgi:hypothetical protein